MDEREMGRLEGRVEYLIGMVQDMKTLYVTKAEYEPRIKALEISRHKFWDKVTGVGSVGAFIVAALALVRTYMGR